MVLGCCYGTAYEDVKINFYGDSNITSGKSESFVTNFYVEYNIPIYKPKHEKWSLFLAGKVNPMYDHLGNEIKMDVFTVIGIDF